MSSTSCKKEEAQARLPRPLTIVHAGAFRKPGAPPTNRQARRRYHSNLSHDLICRLRKLVNTRHANGSIVDNELIIVILKDTTDARRLLVASRVLYDFFNYYLHGAYYGPPLQGIRARWNTLPKVQVLCPDTQHSPPGTNGSILETRVSANPRETWETLWEYVIDNKHHDTRKQNIEKNTRYVHDEDVHPFQVIFTTKAEYKRCANNFKDIADVVALPPRQPKRA